MCLSVVGVGDENIPVASQEEYDKMKEAMEGQINRLRADNAEKLEEYEAKVAALMSGKVDTIFKVGKVNSLSLKCRQYSLDERRSRN